MEYQEQVTVYKSFSQEAEQSVIGGILIDNHRAAGICEMLTSDDFYWEPNRLIFSAIEHCIENNQPLDVIVIADILESMGDLENSGGLAYLAELAHNTPSALNVSAYARVVLDKKKEREVLYMASQMVDKIKADDGSSQERVNNALSVVTNFDHKDEKVKDFEDFQKEYIELLEFRSSCGGGITGLSSGFKDIDARLNGLQKTDLVIIAGRPAQGKTTYALNIASKVARTEQTIVFSMEMSGAQIIEKIYAQHGILMNNLKKGTLDSDEWAKLNTAAINTKALKLTIDDRPALTPQQIRAKCLKLKRQHGSIGLVMIDYLQLMSVNKSQGQVDKITQISGSLKALAKELECTVIALSQLSRDVEKRPNKRPQMADLRDSGAIEQDADIIQFIYRDDYYADQEGRESRAPGVAEIITSKYRGGETGTDYLATKLQYSRFDDLLYKFDPDQEAPKKTKRF